MKVRNFVSALTIIALTSSQVAFAAGVIAGNYPISGPVTSPISSPITINPITSPITAPIIIIKPPVTPKPKPVYSYAAPTMVYPQNNQTLNLEGAYMFKVKKVNGATGYLFGFKQNGKFIFENYANLRTLSPNGEFTILPNDPAHKLFKAGNVEVWIRALVNGRWTDARVITVTLKSKVQTSILSGNVYYQMIREIKIGKYSYKFNTYLPASGVNIEAVNTQTNERILTNTNQFGNYQMTVKNGQYKIRAFDNKQTNFGSTQTLNITKNSYSYFIGVLKTLRFW